MVYLGDGLIILIVLWSVVAAFCIVFCAAQGNVKYVAIVPILIATIVSSVLLALPNASSVAKTTEPDYVFSFVSLIWILALIVICVTLVICLLIYFIGDIMTPHYAKVSKTFNRAR